jgi:nucleotide-binding universal stress UspA family protein
MIRKILAPTDLSKLSLLGARYALTAAKHFDPEVSIYHVVNADEIRKLGDTLTGRSFVRSGHPNVLETYLHTYEVSLAQFVGQNFSDLLPTVKVEEKVGLGSPDKNIVELAKTEKFDLIIMATRGKGGLSRLFLGSVTEQVIRNAPCPVLAIPPYSGEAVGESDDENRFERVKVSQYQALRSKARSCRRHPYVPVGPVDIWRARTKQKDQVILEERKNGNDCERR